MKLVIDVMGFENKMSCAIKACRKFYKKHNDINFVLVGDKIKIEKLINVDTVFEILDAKDVITMDANPMDALRNQETSMYKAIQQVALNKADGVLSAGSTPCYIALVHYLIKNIPGVNKAGFMPFIPTVNNKGFNLLDVGANKECSGNDLLTYAKMASVYCSKTRHIVLPSIGVVNIGQEKSKGFQYHLEADKLLREAKEINYIGFIEPRDLLNGIVDIAICDGYTGNLVLKSMEGGLKTLKNALKKQYKKPWNWLGALFSIITIKAVARTFDYRNNAGAMVIGANKIAFKTHGNADKRQFYSSIKMMYDTIKSNVLEEIKKQINNE